MLCCSVWFLGYGLNLLLSSLFLWGIPQKNSNLRKVIFFSTESTPRISFIFIQQKYLTVAFSAKNCAFDYHYVPPDNHHFTIRLPVLYPLYNQCWNLVVRIELLQNLCKRCFILNKHIVVDLVKSVGELFNLWETK